MLGPSVKRVARLAITRPLENAGMVLLLTVMSASAVAAVLLLLACPASSRCSVAFESAPKKLWGFGFSVAPEASASASASGECDIFEGEWVWDDSYPLYDSRDCPFVDTAFRCSENGRPDTSYAKWRWQPSRCDLPRLVQILFF
jgi:hypothetical protein